MGKSFADIIDAHIEANRTELPVFNETAVRVQQLTSGGDCDTSELEELILSEPVLAAAVLRLANSSFYGGLAQITQVRDAVVRLGSQKVASVVVAVTQRENYQVRDRALRPVIGSLWNHSIACALGAQWLAERLTRKDLAEHAFMAGMLHDLGKLFVLRVVDDLKAQHTRFDPPMPLIHEMMSRMHTSHGALLLRRWNIPELYAEVVARHHDAQIGDDEVLLAIVRLVDLACNKIGVGVEPKPDANVAASAEAQMLGVSEVLAAELEIRLEDAAGTAASI